MKLVFYCLSLAAIFISSCGKDKFECDAQNQMAPADDSSVLFIPTAFSPDNNALNDVFKIYCESMDSVHLEIYDTDNKLLFETSQYEGWSPDNAETGMTLYHYKVTAKSHQGFTYYRCGDLYSCKCLAKGFDKSVLIFGDQFDLSAPQGYVGGPSVEDLKTCE